MANTVAAPESNTQAGAVSCVTSAFCVAVTGLGGDVDALNGGDDYAELWNGSDVVAHGAPDGGRRGVDDTGRRLLRHHVVLRRRRCV